jgi:hypothetical protein
MFLKHHVIHVSLYDRLYFSHVPSVVRYCRWMDDSTAYYQEVSFSHADTLAVGLPQRRQCIFDEHAQIQHSNMYMDDSNLSTTIFGIGA